MRIAQKSLLLLGLSTGLWGCPPKQPIENPVTTETTTPVEPLVPEQKPLTIDEIHAEVNEAAAWLTTADAAQAQQALKKLGKLSADAPELAEIPYNEGVAYEILGDENMARKRYLRATDIDPALSAAWLNLGAIAEREGDLERALSMYRAGQRYAADDPALVVGVINVLRKMGKSNEAISEAKAALAQNANNINVYNNLGLVYVEQGNLELAQFIYQKALSDVPGARQNALIHANLGRVYLLKDRAANAKLELEEALKLDPQLVAAKMFLAELHMDNRDWEATVQVLEEAREVQPENPAIHLNLGIGYRGLGRLEEARRSYEKALELDPNNPDPYLNLAVLLGDHMQAYDEALAALDTYQKQGGTRTELAAEWTTDLERQKKRYERAQARKRRREEAKRREQLAAETEKAEEQPTAPAPAPEPAPEPQTPEQPAPQQPEPSNPEPAPAPEPETPGSEKEKPNENNPWGG